MQLLNVHHDGEVGEQLVQIARLHFARMRFCRPSTETCVIA